MITLLSPHDIHMHGLLLPRVAASAATFSYDRFLASRAATLRHQQHAQPRKPDLFVIGAMKSGTTYLNKLLAAHPEIFMCAPEEPSYFVEPRQLRALWPEAWDQGLWRSEDHYLQLFRDSGEAIHLGESSTITTKTSAGGRGVPERIHEFNPELTVYLFDA